MDKTESKEFENIARVHIWVTGRVQGVGFRAFVLQIAIMTGLQGWVHNLGYDQVEVVAEGPKPILEKFIEIVKAGPRASRVEETNLEWEKPTKEFHQFSVK